MMQLKTCKLKVKNSIHTTPFILLAFFLALGPACARRWDRLSGEEKVVLHHILDRWETWVPAMKNKGRAPLMTFEELYQGLGAGERAFLGRVRAVHPTGGLASYLGGPGPGVKFKRIKNQRVTRNGRPEKLGPQVLPKKAYKAYKKMMKAMKKDLGKKLLVESGYRSPAYQLYTFLYYLPRHRYSLAETGRWVALPGYSEHGAPHRQAIDFINEEGINGDDEGQTAEDFERLPEYAWLQKNAGRFGFELSYPRGRPGVTFEPWHWRYAEKKGTGYF